MTGQRCYAVWIKGKRTHTEMKMWAYEKHAAIMHYALRHGVKLYQVDAVWLKSEPIGSDTFD